jgi:hypothetical protein
MQMQPDGTKHFEGVPQEQQATLDRLVSIHRTAGEYLHSANPFDANAEQREADMRARSRERIIAEHAHLKTILAEHSSLASQRYQAFKWSKPTHNPPVPESSQVAELACFTGPL